MEENKSMQLFPKHKGRNRREGEETLKGGDGTI